MTTIRDIAKRTGVSPATVSKVLNGYPDVRQSTRQRIESVIAELGYHPGALGRNQSTGQSKVIGLFYTADGYGSLVHPFFQEVLDSFKETLGQQGYDVLFFSVDSSDEREDNFKERAQKKNIDGVVLVGIARTDRRISSLAIGELPCMSIDLDLAGARAGYVMSDNLGGAVQAVECLVGMGHRRIAFIGDKYGTKPGHDRLIGYQRALQSNQLVFRPEWVLDGDFYESGGYEATRQLMDSGDVPTAIFYSGDLMAIGGMKAIHEAGLVVGKDISVVGFDDIPLARYVHPGLTTIRQAKRVMGAKVADCLIQLIEDPQMIPPIVTLPIELVVRESVGPPQTH